MGFVKKNAFLLGCAVVALASLGCMGWGIARMSLVREDMQRSQKLNASFANISKNRINIKSIDFENKRIELIGRHHQEVIDQFAESCDRKPLIENLFPDPPAGEEGRRLQYDFPPQYRKAMQKLVEKLNAGHPPTAREVEDTRDYLKKKELQAAQFEDAMGGSAAGSTGNSPPAPGGRQMPGSGRAEKDALPAVEGPQSAKPLWSAIEENAKHDPEMLSSISRAREIRCYADTAIGRTFDYHPIYRETDRRPKMKEIWEAQLLYWMQADVVDAIAAVNDKAAAQLGDGEKIWVGNMPVKDVFSIRVSDYVNEDSVGGGGRSDASDLPPVNPDEACTHQVTESLYDVINIRVVLAIDVRDLPIILGEFMHQRYFTVLNVGYTAVRPSMDFRGKIYGPEPVAKATIDLQAYLCYRSFVPLMPEAVREWLGTQAQFEDLMKEKEEAQPDAEQDDSKT